MKTFLVMTLLLFPSAALGQSTDITRLQSTCLPTAPLSTLRAVVQVLSKRIHFRRGVLRVLSR